MFSRYSSKFKLAAAIFSVILCVVLLGYFLINSFIGKVEVEELKPITSKTAASRKLKEQQPTIGALIKVTEGVKSSEVVNLDFNVITSRGEDLLVLINKKISLSQTFVPQGLISLEGMVSAYPGAQMKNEAALALQEMLNTAKGEKGVVFTVVSSYRSYQDQVRVFSGWVASAGQKSAESFSAKPGHSQHQLGTAVD